MNDMHDWNTAVIKEFRANGGKVGGQFAGAPLLLLTTTGARTGRQNTTPLMYLPDGDRYLIFASFGGAPTHPAWYHNVLANSTVTVEVGSETFQARATDVTGPERDRLYAEQARRYANFAEYQAKTTRVIPVVALERVP
jgi:deazaflavin-dependent oxidoreductase (nitroreductase family)